MASEQIDKEKPEKVKEIPTRTDVIEEPSMAPTELGKMKLVDKTPPKESNRQYAKKVGDYEKIVEAAGENGVDLNNMDKMPLMDSDKDKISEAVKGMYPKEFAKGINSLANSITAPQNEERNKIDVKAQMALEKKKRRSAWADALYAFGEGLQGKTANQENFVSTKIQRKQDEEFQNFKDVTERNKKTKYLYENQVRKELVDWAEDQAKNEKIDARERAKFQQLADQYKQTSDRQNRDSEERVRHNKAMENKPTGSEDKANRPVIVQTAQKTYKLKPEEAAFYKGEILKNADTLRKKYPGWFTENQTSKTNLDGTETKGPITYKLNPEVSDADMIRAYLENKENPGLNEDAYEQNKASYFDKYRKEKGLSTAPASQETKSGATQKQQTAKPKADPLGLGF